MTENAKRLIKHVVVVGGGTAGWLTANHLAKRLEANSASAIQVTLIESPDIPTIGVGEGTVPAIRKTLQYLGISETDFIRECDASFKQGANKLFRQLMGESQSHPCLRQTLHHLENIGGVLEEMLTLSDLTRLEFHGPAGEIDLLREPLAQASDAEPKLVERTRLQVLQEHAARRALAI